MPNFSKTRRASLNTPKQTSTMGTKKGLEARKRLRSSLPLTVLRPSKSTKKGAATPARADSTPHRKRGRPAKTDSASSKMPSAEEEDSPRAKRVRKSKMLSDDFVVYGTTSQNSSTAYFSNQLQTDDDYSDNEDFMPGEEETPPVDNGKLVPVVYLERLTEEMIEAWCNPRRSSRAIRQSLEAPSSRTTPKHGPASKLKGPMARKQKMIRIIKDGKTTLIQKIARDDKSFNKTNSAKGMAKEPVKKVAASKEIQPPVRGKTQTVISKSQGGKTLPVSKLAHSVKSASAGRGQPVGKSTPKRLPSPARDTAAAKSPPAKPKPSTSGSTQGPAKQPSAAGKSPPAKQAVPESKTVKPPGVVKEADKAPALTKSTPTVKPGPKGKAVKSEKSSSFGNMLQERKISLSDDKEGLKVTLKPDGKGASKKVSKGEESPPLLKVSGTKAEEYVLCMNEDGQLLYVPTSVAMSNSTGSICAQVTLADSQNEKASTAASPKGGAKDSPAVDVQPSKSLAVPKETLDSIKKGLKDSKKPVKKIITDGKKSNEQDFVLCYNRLEDEYIYISRDLIHPSRGPVSKPKTGEKAASPSAATKPEPEVESKKEPEGHEKEEPPAEAEKAKTGDAVVVETLPQSTSKAPEKKPAENPAKPTPAKAAAAPKKVESSKKGEPLRLALDPSRKPPVTKKEEDLFFKRVFKPTNVPEWVVSQVRQHYLKPPAVEKKPLVFTPHYIMPKEVSKSATGTVLVDPTTDEILHLGYKGQTESLTDATAALLRIGQEIRRDIPEVKSPATVASTGTKDDWINVFINGSSSSQEAEQASSVLQQDTEVSRAVVVSQPGSSAMEVAHMEVPASAAVYENAVISLATTSDSGGAPMDVILGTVADDGNVVAVQGESMEFTQQLVQQIKRAEAGQVTEQQAMPGEEMQPQEVHMEGEMLVQEEQAEEMTLQEMQAHEMLVQAQDIPIHQQQQREVEIPGQEVDQDGNQVQVIHEIPAQEEGQMQVIHELPAQSEGEMQVVHELPGQEEGEMQVVHELPAQEEGQIQAAHEGSTQEEGQMQVVHELAQGEDQVEDVQELPSQEGDQMQVVHEIPAEQSEELQMQQDVVQGEAIQQEKMPVPVSEMQTEQEAQVGSDGTLSYEQLAQQGVVYNDELVYEHDVGQAQVDTESQLVYEEQGTGEAVLQEQSQIDYSQVSQQVTDPQYAQAGGDATQIDYSSIGEAPATQTVEAAPQPPKAQQNRVIIVVGDMSYVIESDTPVVNNGTIDPNVLSALINSGQIKLPASSASSVSKAGTAYSSVAQPSTSRSLFSRPTQQTYTPPQRQQTLLRHTVLSPAQSVLSTGRSLLRSNLYAQKQTVDLTGNATSQASSINRIS